MSWGAKCLASTSRFIREKLLQNSRVSAFQGETYPYVTLVIAMEQVRKWKTLHKKLDY